MLLTKYFAPTGCLGSLPLVSARVQLYKNSKLTVLFLTYFVFCGGRSLERSHRLLFSSPCVAGAVLERHRQVRAVLRGESHVTAGGLDKDFILQNLSPSPPEAFFP